MPHVYLVWAFWGLCAAGDPPSPGPVPLRTLPVYNNNIIHLLACGVTITTREKTVLVKEEEQISRCDRYPRQEEISQQIILINLSGLPVLFTNPSIATRTVITTTTTASSS